MKREIITIDGQDYEIGFSLRGIRHFEEIAKKSIEQCIGTWDNVIYMYSVLKALNKNFKMEFETFVDYLDNNTDLLIQFTTLDLSPDEPLSDPDEVKKKTPTQNLFVLWMLSLLLLVLPVLLPIISTIACVGLSLWLLVRLIGKIGKKRV